MRVRLFALVRAHEAARCRPYPVGSRIYHDEYGEGTISGVGRVGRRVQVAIDFDEAGKKRLFPAFTLLRRIR